MRYLVQNYIRFFRFDIHRAFMSVRLPRYAAKIKGRLVDIGAGRQPYRTYFNVDEYITTNAIGHYADEVARQIQSDYWIEDASGLPFESEEFDSALCFQVMSVVKKPDAFFSEVFRILKPGGKFLLTTDWLYPSWSQEDRQRFSVTTLCRMAEASGLTICAWESFGGQRSLAYMLQTRWVLSYSQRIKSANGFKKIARLFQFAYYLIVLPLYTAKGFWAFLMERSVNDNAGQTYNILLFAEKPGRLDN